MFYCGGFGGEGLRAEAIRADYESHSSRKAAMNAAQGRSEDLSVKTRNEREAGNCLLSDFLIVCDKEVSLGEDGGCGMNRICGFQPGLGTNGAVLLGRFGGERQQFDFTAEHELTDGSISRIILDRFGSHQDFSERENAGAESVSTLVECLVSLACLLAEDRVSFKDVGE